MDITELLAAPPLLGTAAILVGLALFWIGSMISTFRHFPGLGGRARLLGLLEPGQVEWAVAVLVGVALSVVGAGAPSRADVPASAKPPTSPGVGVPGPDHPPAGHSRTVDLLFSAVFVAAVAVGGAAVLNVFVELTLLGDGVNAAGTGIFHALAAVPIAGVAAFWAHQIRAGRRSRRQ